MSPEFLTEKLELSDSAKKNYASPNFPSRPINCLPSGLTTDLISAQLVGASGEAMG